MHQVQGPRAPLALLQRTPSTSRSPFLLATGALRATLSRSGRYLASCFPAGSSWVPAIHINLCCARRSPLYLRRCRQTTVQNAYFLFHMIPSWIKCFRQLIDASSRGQYRGSSVVLMLHPMSSCSHRGGMHFPNCEKIDVPRSAPQPRAVSLKREPLESQLVKDSLATRRSCCRSFVCLHYLPEPCAAAVYAPDPKVP